MLIFDGYSRAIVGAGCFERQNFSRVLQVFRHAFTQWGAPEAVVSDHGAVFVALAPCLRQLEIQWAPTTKGHPWQNRAESGFAIQRRMLDAYVVGCTEREQYITGMLSLCGIISFGGIGRINAKMPRAASIISPQKSYSGRPVVSPRPRRLRRALRLRQLTRTVRQHGEIRLHNFELYVDPGLWGHTVEVWVYEDLVRIEHAEHVQVAYPCVYDPRQRRLTQVDARGRQQWGQVPLIQLVLWALALERTVWPMPRYHRTTPPRRGLLTLQISWLPYFTN